MGQISAPAGLFERRAFELSLRCLGNDTIFMMSNKINIKE